MLSGDLLVGFSLANYAEIAGFSLANHVEITRFSLANHVEIARFSPLRTLLFPRAKFPKERKFRYHRN
jgi:hypothetical protein